MYLRELRVTYGPARAAGTAERVRAGTVSAPREAARMIGPLIEAEAIEVFGVLLVDARHRAIAWHVVSRGGIASAPVEPAAIFRAALLANAAAIIAAHNHPSGDPQPSHDDREITSRLRAAGTLIGVEVLDHLIIGEGGAYFSFKEGGL